MAGRDGGYTPKDSKSSRGKPPTAVIDIELATLAAILRRLIKSGLVRTVTDRDGNHSLESCPRRSSITLSPDEAKSVRALFPGELG